MSFLDELPIDYEELTPEQAHDLIRTSTLDWFETYACVEGVDAQHYGDLTANDLQLQIDDAVSFMVAEGEPVRVIVAKPRKEGASTYISGIGYTHLRRSKGKALLMGDSKNTTSMLFEQQQYFAAHDRFDWGNFLSVTAEGMTFSHGSEIQLGTAGSIAGGKRGRTPTFIHCTEVAHYGAVDTKRDAQKVMLGLMNSMAMVKGTYAFLESTTNGIGNYYHTVWCGAVTLEEFKAGKRGNGWIKIFTPWHKGRINTLPAPLAESEKQRIRDTLTSREVRGMQLYGWTYEQIEWRRRKIAGDCGGSELLFDQEYPESEEVMFISSGRGCFLVSALTELELQADVALPVMGRFGVNRNPLNHHQVSANFTATERAEAWWEIFEDPMPGHYYLMTADVALGETLTTGGDTDSHAVGIWRRGFLKDGTTWIPAKLVAHMRTKGPLSKCSITELAHQMQAASIYYGRCRIAWELNNNGTALLLRLQDLNCNLYFQNRKDAQGKTKETPGWLTTEPARRHMIDCLSELLNAVNLDIACPEIITQLRTFIVNSNGRPEAQEGCHDDEVIMAAMAAALLESQATLFAVHQQTNEIPADIARWKDYGGIF